MAAVVAGAAGHFGAGAHASLGRLWRDLPGRLAAALQAEIEDRRPFLWVPAAAGAGVLLYMVADREPVLWLPALLAAAFAAVAVLMRRRRLAFALAIAAAAVFVGLLSASWRSARVAAPVLDRPRIVRLTGYIEEMDFRLNGARFILRVASAPELSDAPMPLRVRLTTKRTPELEAGSFVSVRARLLPPAHAALPGGYDFARDAYFEQIGAVGSVLGAIEPSVAPAPPDMFLAARMALDRARNALAQRVDAIVGGEEGAIAAAMVTGKRDLLSDDTKELIREAGIFHIITISGVQMTLVAGILFFAVPRLLALSRTLALRLPIKKIAAVVAMIGAIAYDIATGSRVGTERALLMTLIMLTAVLFDRRAFTMRNLAYAALAVLAVEPEAILGASFQLSFAAVAALVAVFESRSAARQRQQDVSVPPAQPLSVLGAPGKALTGIRHLIFATFCATAATASFMAYNFHELSPFVLLGNPLTLGLIELFAIPGALIGTILYPLGLDAFVWVYVGAGIKFILWIARFIAAAPGATLHLNTFAPWAIVFLSLAVLSIVIWRTRLMRLTALPFIAFGVAGAMAGPRYDIVIAPGGEAAAIRGSDGRLGILGAHANAFDAEQWLRADGDGAKPSDTRSEIGRCDRLGCIAELPNGWALSLVLDPDAFEEDCARAAIIATRLTAPANCKAAIIIDHDKLRRGGATALTLAGGQVDIVSARAADSDRPWSPAPRLAKRWQPEPAEEKSAQAAETSTDDPLPPSPAEPQEMQ